ncbi:transcriptional regulator [Methanobrevibacter millerae]|uniref:Transcriptional regulator n=1 Tax=Methanobrevibacter millerae TaxID=230361 RepID=A0A0U3E4J4_9EURY|nr:transcriptional regulator [Methanobrevibacter millerae]ALT68951.1 transcriptional regulator [Methanobrevibacter millerae]
MNDETLKIYAYVITSTYRKKVVKSLSKRDMIPTQIAYDSDILPNHVSKVLRELKEKDVVVCTNEQDRKNRNYHLTDLGMEIAEELK